MAESKESKKKELVQKTYELLKTESPATITIRAIAAAADCTSTVIYKHFKDLDQLVFFSSVKFLEDYIADVHDIMTSRTEPMEMLSLMWQSFAKVAFSNIEVVDNLFWGKYSSGLGDAIFEYYQMFPNEFKRLDGLLTSIYFSGTIEERNRIVVNRIAATGVFSFNDVDAINELQCCAFRGVMDKYKPLYRDPEKANEAYMSFNKMMESLVNHYRLKK